MVGYRCFRGVCAITLTLYVLQCKPCVLLTLGQAIYYIRPLAFQRCQWCAQATDNVSRCNDNPRVIALNCLFFRIERDLLLQPIRRIGCCESRTGGQVRSEQFQAHKYVRILPRAVIIKSSNLWECARKSEAGRGTCHHCVLSAHCIRVLEHVASTSLAAALA